MNFDATPVQPPGMENVTFIINWVAWGVALIAFLGFLAGIAYLVTGAIQGRDTQGVKVIGIALVACILVGAAGAIVGTLL